jgi:hypothetical protein
VFTWCPCYCYSVWLQDKHRFRQQCGSVAMACMLGSEGRCSMSGIAAMPRSHQVSVPNSKTDLDSGPGCLNAFFSLQLFCLSHDTCAGTQQQWLPCQAALCRVLLPTPTTFLVRAGMCAQGTKHCVEYVVIHAPDVAAARISIFMVKHVDRFATTDGHANNPLGAANYGRLSRSMHTLACQPCNSVRWLGIFSLEPVP